MYVLVGMCCTCEAYGFEDKEATVGNKKSELLKIWVKCTKKRVLGSGMLDLVGEN